MSQAYETREHDFGDDYIAKIELFYDEESTPFDWVGSISDVRNYHSEERRIVWRNYHTGEFMISWFIPELGHNFKSNFEYFQKQGDSKGSAYQRATDIVNSTIEHVKEWLQSDWSYVGVNITMQRENLFVEADSLWGVESDMLEETIRDILDNLYDNKLVSLQKRIDESSQAVELIQEMLDKYN